MAAPVGNTFAAKTKRWQKALERALARQSSDGTVDGGLNAIADTVVELAKAGSKDAWREIGDRLDGKPSMSIEVREQRELREWTDAELAAIIATLASRGSADPLGSSASTPEPDSVH